MPIPTPIPKSENPSVSTAIAARTPSRFFATLSNSPLRTRLVNLIGIIAVLLVWQVAGAHLGDALLATPVQVAGALAQNIIDPQFWRAFGWMVLQMLLGYVLALVVGIPLGVAMGRSQRVRALVKPWASMFVVVSAAALVPLFILMMGRGVLLTTAIVFAATVWYAVLTMSEAARAVPPALINVARSFGANNWQIFRSVLMPSLHPYVQIAARIGLTHALRGIVTAQMFVSTGYGGLLNNAGLDMSTAGLFSLIVVLMVASTCATACLRWYARRSAPWYTSKTQR